MTSPMARDAVDFRQVNTPLIGICTVSMLFNSVQNGVFRPSNMFTNFFLIASLSISNGLNSTGDSPLWSARLGVFSALVFTAAAPLKCIFTSRLFPRTVHYGIGAFYTTYHSLRWYKELNYFEDAGEDVGDEKF